VLERARGRVETVELGVGIANAPAIELYLTCGFRPYAIDADAVRVDGMPVDEVLMRRTV
jgi:RimJ/RimL family protein N-acetyltransferase